MVQLHPQEIATIQCSRVYILPDFSACTQRSSWSFVSVCWDCSNKNSMSKWLINSRNFILTVLRSEIKVQAISVSGQGPLPGEQTVVFSLWPPWWKGRRALWASFIQALIPFMWALPPWPKSLRKYFVTRDKEWFLLHIIRKKCTFTDF